MLQRIPIAAKPAALGELPPAPGPGIDRFVLVSRRAHLDGLDRSRPGQLLVSSSWLLWQELLQEGWLCAHIESALSTADPDNLLHDIYVRSNDWIYLDGADATEFAGVSLGRKTVREVSLLILERERLFHSLDALVSHYGPNEIVFHDMRAETSLLDARGRLGVVQDIAEKHGTRVADETDPTPDSDPYMPIRPYYGTSENDVSEGGLKKIVRDAVFRTISGLSGLRKLLGDRRPGVLFMSNQLSSTALLDAFDGHSAVPVVPIDWFPGKTRIGFMLKCILRGVRIPMPETAGLTDAETARIDRIIARFKSAWKEPAAENKSYIHRFIASEIFDSRRLHTIAAECRRAHRQLSRNGVRLIFTDGLQNRTINAAMEIAKTKGIATGVSWHGPYIQDYKLDILGCDPRYDRVVDYCLTWGDVHEKWLDAIGSGATDIRIGNLVIAGQPEGSSPPADGKNNALILQYAAPHADILWPQAGQYGFFVAAARAYRDAGYRNLRLKLHPGPSKIDYYARIASLFDIDCEIVIEGPFMDHVDWADSVTGPVHSGAMLEVMRAGKPYLPALYGPHGINRSYLDETILIEDDNALNEAVAAGYKPDARPTLERFASAYSIPDPAAAAWSAFERIANRNEYV